MHKRRILWLQILTHVAALSPLALLVWDFAQGQLTVNPIQDIQLRTGKYALVLLVLSLACTPVNIVFGFTWALLLRRTLGLYAFMYAGMHFLNFVWLDYSFDFSLIWEDIGDKRYMVAGFAAFLGLLPLAVTSTKGWMKRLGKNWVRLHWLIYIAAALAVIHFAWQVKADFRVPLLYGVVVALLLIVRIPAIRKVTNGFRNQFKRKQ